MDYNLNETDYEKAVRLSLETHSSNIVNQIFRTNSNSKFSRHYKPKTWSIKPLDDRYKTIEISRNIILPEVALQELSANGCNFPFIMKLHNEEEDITTYCGVEEFSANAQQAMLARSVYNDLELSAHSQLLCEYVELYTAKKLVFVSNKPIKDQKGYKTAIRNKIGKLSCLSYQDSITV